MDNKDFQSYGLSTEMLKALDTLGYKKPTEVQEKVIPLVLKDRDVIVKSQTGSGKTAAFAVPICEKLELEVKSPQVLVLTPTRELAVQIKDDFVHIGRFKRFRCAAVYGKQPIEIQKRELKQRVHVVVGTPGRTYDHINKGTFDLQEIKYMVIDEADKMLDMGFIDQVEEIVRLIPRNRITMLFSATMPEKIEEICSKYMLSPVRVEIKPRISATEKIKQYYYESEGKDKFELVKKVIYTEKPDSCIIFCNTRERVDELLKSMKKEKFFCEGLHGGMEQADRLDIIKQFKKGEFHFLVATDVAARGLHIDDITHVINYEVPMEKESYVHRIGRTGRVENEGVAVTLAAPWEMKFLKDIEEYIGYAIPKKDIPSYEEIERGRMSYEDRIKTKPKPKKDQARQLDKEITKIRINAGKSKKMRPGDIVGAITSIEGVKADDIGIIDVQDTCSYVEIFGKNGDRVAKALQNTKIKGKIYTIKKVSLV